MWKNVKESEELQKQGWVVTEVKTIDGVKQHFLINPEAKTETKGDKRKNEK